MANIIRMTSQTAKILREHLATNRRIEQFCFFHMEKVETTRLNNLYIVRELTLPDSMDLYEQGAVFVSPERRLQLYTYQRAKDKGLGVIDLHTHWFQKNPSFSHIDLSSARKEAEFFRSKMPEEVDYGLMVSNADFTSYSGLVLNKKTGDFDPLSTVEILGSPMETLSLDERIKVKDERYVRHYLIPEWKQNVLSEMKVVVVGAGGNGSHIIQALACMGIGSENGHLMIIDDDVVEESNISRIPYAKTSDIGKAKVKVAASYIRSKNHKIRVITRQKSIHDKNVQKLATDNHFIFGCVDSEKARMTLSEVAYKACIPYLDLASEIIPDENFSGAQTRLVLPYQGCLHCIGGIDASEAALESLSDETKAIHQAAGYVRGTDQSPTPSVIHLNGVIAYIGVAVFIKTIFGEPVDKQKTVIYDQGKMSLLTATFNRNENCPLCGNKPSDEDMENDLEELRKNTGQIKGIPTLEEKAEQIQRSKD